MILSFEEEYAKSLRSLPAKAFISVGQLEAIKEPEFAGMLSNTAKMIEKINSRQYMDFSLNSHIFNDETHLSVIPSTFSRGLRAVYN